ncbi:MAG: alpha/beta hydrolase [Bacteroidota bacterium]
MANLRYKNINLHYTVEGSGSAVVLLHGFLENTTMWDEIVPHLAKRNKVVCIDLLGHGKTENYGYIHTMEEQSEMVKYILDHLKLRRYILIGHSMGGYVALDFAEKFSKNVKGLCLMNSTALPDDEEKIINRDRSIVAVKRLPEMFVKLAIPNLFSEKNKTVFVKKIKEITKEALMTSQQGIIAALEGMKIRKDRTAILQSSKFPMLMVRSKEDPALDFQSLIDQTENTSVLIHELPDGHMSHVENRDELISAFKNFIKICK